LHEYCAKSIKCPPFCHLLTILQHEGNKSVSSYDILTHLNTVNRKSDCHSAGVTIPLAVTDVIMAVSAGVALLQVAGQELWDMQEVFQGR